MGLAIPFDVGQVFTNNQGDRGTIVKFVTGTKFIQRRAIVEFEDGTQVSVSTSKLTSGSWKNPNKPVVCGVGFIGVGEYKSSHKREVTRAYGKWRSMLNRCYNEKCPEFKLYGGKGVTVCEEWHNFQNFAKWFYSKDKLSSTKDLQLDKDVRHPTDFTGTLYSPDFCCLISPRVNALMGNIALFKVYTSKVKGVKSWKICEKGAVYYCSEDKDLVELFFSEFKLKKLLEVRRRLERATTTEDCVLKDLDLKIYNYTKDVVMKDKEIFLEKIKPF